VRVTLIGHATLLFETSEATVLVDPVLSDPFEGGAVSSWPERTIDLAALPRPDYVVVSHVHFGRQPRPKTEIDALPPATSPPRDGHHGRWTPIV
jgi:hypothetical protein